MLRLLADPSLAADEELALGFAVSEGLAPQGARLPILIGTAIGYLFALIAGGTSAAGRDILGWQVSGVNMDAVRDASFFGMPDFDPADSYGSCLVLVPDTGELFQAFAAAMNAIAKANEKIARFIFSVLLR